MLHSDSSTESFPGADELEERSNTRIVEKNDIYDLIGFIQFHISSKTKLSFKTPGEAIQKLEELIEQLNVLNGLIAATGNRASYSKTEEGVNALVKGIFNGEKYTEKDLEKRLAGFAARTRCQQIADFFCGSFFEILKVIITGGITAALGAVAAPVLGAPVAAGAIIGGFAGGGSLAAHSFLNRNPVANQVKNLKGALLELQGGPAASESTGLMSRSPSSSRN